MLVFVVISQLLIHPNATLAVEASKQIPARVEEQKQITARIRKSSTAWRISFRQFNRDTPLLAFTLRFVGTRRGCVATSFRVAFCGKDGGCCVGDCAGFGGSGQTDGESCDGCEKFVGLLHGENRDVVRRGRSFCISKTIHVDPFSTILFRSMRNSCQRLETPVAACWQSGSDVRRC